MNNGKRQKFSTVKYFEQFGEIDDIFCIVDRGFGFVTLIDEGDNLKPIIQESHHEVTIYFK